LASGPPGEFLRDCAGKHLDHPIGSSKKHRLIILDDHPMMRFGMAQFLNQEEDLFVCAGVSRAVEAMRAIALTQPDLAITDLVLADKSGLELIKDFRIQFPSLAVLVHCTQDERLFADRALRAGARGYLMKQERPDELIAAVRRVLAGGIYLSPRLSALYSAGRPGSSSRVPRTPIALLSDRELEVMQLIGAGFNNHEIASQLHLSVKTVDAHREHIKKKLGLETATALNLFAVRFAASGGPV
jgi:DNA-binding NarL/FixJ family response regulator